MLGCCGGRDKGEASLLGGESKSGDGAEPPFTVTNVECSLEASESKTAPIDGMKPGTSGLRKKTKVFTETEHYLENFLQATFDALRDPALGGIPETLVVSGDGRYYNKEATQVIIKMAAANGVKRVWVGCDGLLSTPAMSAIIRERDAGGGQGTPGGGIILTASHNPGGPDEDFGIKYNIANGGPAPESVTNAIFEASKTIAQYCICAGIPDVDLSTPYQRYEYIDKSNTFTVEIMDETAEYRALLEQTFDFDLLRALLARPDFSFVYDSMHGVAGPQAKKILGVGLGASKDSLMNCEPKEDFGGGHPDPNLT